MEIKSSLQVLRDESWASWLFRGFSALTTFLFLFEYGEAFLGSLLLRVSVLFPNVDYFYFDLFGRAFAGMMGVLFIEWAMLQWRGRQLNSAQNEDQAGIAANMDKRLGTAAWIMSCVYLVLSLIGYFFGNDPIFTDVTKWVGVMGVITVIGAAAMNFIEDQAYERNSPDFTERLAYRKYQNKIRADAAARAQAQVDSQRNTLVQVGADHKEREMVDDTMRHLTGANDTSQSPTLPAQPSKMTKYLLEITTGGGVQQFWNNNRDVLDAKVVENPKTLRRLFELVNGRYIVVSTYSPNGESSHSGYAWDYEPKEGDIVREAGNNMTRHAPRSIPTGQPIRANAPRQANGVPDLQDTITVSPPQRQRVASEGQLPANFQQRAHGPE